MARTGAATPHRWVPAGVLPNRRRAPGATPGALNGGTSMVIRFMAVVASGC